jgi:hypothetical protein
MTTTLTLMTADARGCQGPLYRFSPPVTATATVVCTGPSLFPDQKVILHVDCGSDEDSLNVPLTAAGTTTVPLVNCRSLKVYPGDLCPYLGGVVNLGSSWPATVTVSW